MPARWVDVSRQTINALETGRHELPLAFALADVFRDQLDRRAPVRDHHTVMRS